MTTTRMASRLMTAEEFFDFEGEEGYRYDLVDGKLDRMAAAGRRHGRIAVRFSRVLNAFVDEHRLGEVYAEETGFILAPDVSFVRAERITADLDEDGFLALAPDFAVEAISPSQRAGKIREKSQRYLNAGVPLLVLIYPRHRRVTVHRGHDTVEELDETSVFDGGGVLPGFRLPVADIFGA